MQKKVENRRVLKDYKIEWLMKNNNKKKSLRADYDFFI